MFKQDLKNLIAEFFTIGDSYFYELKRHKSGYGIGTVSLEDFQEVDDEFVDKLSEFLYKRGVCIMSTTSEDESDSLWRD